MLDGLEQLLSEQTARGAFPSAVEGNGTSQVDETCFVTAQVALILGVLADQGALVRDAHARALDFVEACASADVPGAFRFYPETLDGPRLAIFLSADGDDTALAWLALLRAGRRTKDEARSALPPLFDRLRAGGPQRGDAPWVRSGVYRTWFDGQGGPADICVNANILAVLAEAGCEPAEPDRAAKAVNAACATVEPSKGSLRMLAPFYADAAEIAIALERAVAAGVAALAPAAERAASLDLTDRRAGRPLDRPLYCNAHGRPLWRSASLQRARRCRDLAAASALRDDLFLSPTGGGHVLHV
jgi:hypothetical protein